MRRFIFSVAAVAMIFLGVGALVERTGAKFKSDEKALDLVRKARLAIGGDAAVGAVKSLSIKGRTTTVISINGAERSETGDTEIALQFPDKMMKMVKIGDGNAGGQKVMDHKFDVIVTGDKAKFKSIEPLRTDATGNAEKRIVLKKKDGTTQEMTGAEAEAFLAANPNVPGEKTIVLRKADGTEQTFNATLKDKSELRHGNGGTRTWTTEDGQTFDVDIKHVILDKVAGGHGEAGLARSNDLLRMAISLLLTAPEGMDVSYTYGGESTLDGIAANVVIASFGGDSFKLFLDRASNLPVGMSYSAARLPKVVAFDRSAAPAGDVTKDVRVFARTAAAPGPNTEFVVRFADYRSVGGVQLPFKWTQTVGGAADETFEVTSYDINPADIGSKFDNQNVKIRMAKPATK